MLNPYQLLAVESLVIITHGTVTDMFDIQIWPIFNIADICICAGIALLCYVLIFKGEEL